MDRPQKGGGANKGERGREVTGGDSRSPVGRGGRHSPSQGRGLFGTSPWRGTASTHLLYQVTAITTEVPPLAPVNAPLAHATTCRYTQMQNQGEGQGRRYGSCLVSKSTKCRLKIYRQTREDLSGAVRSGDVHWPRPITTPGYRGTKW